MTSRETRSCPCKKLPQCLSSFTAAEYGNVDALARLGPSVADRTDAFGYTPLHLAAQNGHVAATCLLLKLGTNVDGKPSSNRSVGTICGATPLHRASYSGAVSTMKILLEWNEGCDMLAKDSSFGDNMTPLHKAAAGGRYLAVQLLLNTMRSRDEASRRARGDDSPLLFSMALETLDSEGCTPLAVAERLVENQEENQKSVKRWDAVAGGSADWGKCVELLRAAEAEVHPGKANPGSRSDRSAQIHRPALDNVERLPIHLTSGSAASCLDCDAMGDGRCLTASWEAAFQGVLAQSVNLTLRENSVRPKQQHVPVTSEQQYPDIEENASEIDANSQQENNSPVGLECKSCGTVCFALCPRSDGSLVCRTCARTKKKSSKRNKRNCK